MLSPPSVNTRRHRGGGKAWDASVRPPLSASRARPSASPALGISAHSLCTPGAYVVVRPLSFRGTSACKATLPPLQQRSCLGGRGPGPRAGPRPAEQLAVGPSVLSSNQTPLSFQNPGNVSVAPLQAVLSGVPSTSMSELPRVCQYFLRQPWDSCTWVHWRRGASSFPDAAAPGAGPSALDKSSPEVLTSARANSARDSRLQSPELRADQRPTTKSSCHSREFWIS